MRNCRRKAKAFYMVRIVLAFTVFLLFTGCYSRPKNVEEPSRESGGGKMEERKTGPDIEPFVDDKGADFKVEYTDLVETECVDSDSDEEQEWSVQECKGAGGYRLQVVEGDLQQTINVISPDGKKFELNLWSVVSNRPSTVGDRAEWRLEGKPGSMSPVALIVRYNVNADLENVDKIVSYLTVSKISPAGACVTSIVPPMKSANIEARKRAAKALTSKCLPVKTG